MSQTYLDRTQSETFKGFLILLIVFGHNHILCPNTESGGLLEYLYSFHIVGFFILPFFYKQEIALAWDKVERTIIRTWVPYLWTCALCWLLYSIMSSHFEFGWNHIGAFFMGTQTPICHYFGYVFPWFLPTYCSFSILLLVARKYKLAFWLITLIGVATFFMSWIEFYRFKDTVPLGIGLALNYFASGAIAFYANKLSPMSKYFGGVFFIVLSVCWWCNIALGRLYQLMPVTFFLLLLCLLPHVKMSWLRLLGRNSLGIYLFNLYIINVLERVLPHGLLGGLVLLVASVIISLLISIGINKIHILRVILFPMSRKEILSATTNGD